MEISKLIILPLTICTLIHLSACVRAPGQKSAESVDARSDGIRQMTTIINNPDKLECGNQTDQTLDQTLHRLLHQQFPTTPRHLRQFCVLANRIVQFTQLFVKKCLNEFSKKIVSFVMFPIRREFKTVCKSGKPGPKARELMIAANCGNYARPGLERCYYDFVNQELGMAQAPIKTRIPMVCCAFNQLRQCFIAEAEEVKECTPRTIDYMARWATEIYGELMDIMCYEYPESSDKCVKVIDNIPEVNVTDVDRPRSFISPLIKLFGDLDEDEV